MSDSQSMRLPELTKEDFKNMAKQREKAKRDQNAKQAKISAIGEPAMPASVSFPAPVKVAGEDANIGRIMGLRFEDFNNMMKQCRTTDVVGVERQPATPLPGKSVDRKFFNSSSASRNLNYHSNSRPNKSSAHSQNSVSNCSRNDGKYYKPIHGDEKANSVSSSSGSKVETISNKSSSSERPSLQNANKPDQKLESSSSHDHNKLVTQDHHIKTERGQSQAHSSSRKESVQQSVKHAPIRTREPVLQSMNKELISQSKPEINQSGASNQILSMTNRTEENKDGRQTGDARNVLREKEENRNADVVNSAKLKNRPKLHIPENVEEMLKEFQVPQPLTGIQTPFKESKFPFSDKIQDRKDLNINGKSSKDLMKSLSEMSTAPNDAVKTNVPEDIQDSSSSSSGSSSSEGEDDDDDDDDDSSVGNNHHDEGFDLDGIIETGEHPANSEAAKSTVTTSQSTSEKRRPFIAEKVPPLNTDTSVQKTTEENENHRMGQSCSSSESSSSGSDSDSDNTSDSESDKDVSEDENHHVTPQGTPKNQDNMETSPSSGSKKWNLGAFLQQPQSINMGSKPPSCEAPASNKSDHFEEDTEMKRGADHVSDENPPSVDQDLLSKPMSADEFSPPAPIETKHILSPIKSPLAPPIKSPLPAIVSPLHYHTPKPAERSFSSSFSANEVPSRSKTADQGKYKDCYTSPSKSVTDGPETKGRRPRKKKQNIVSAPIIDTSDSDSDIDVEKMSSDSALSSPQKPLPQNSQLSQKYSPLDKCSANLGTVKRKETKREKLLKEKDSVKLKREIGMASVSNKDCDSKKSAPRMYARSFTDSIDDMLDKFSGEKPLSPIRSVTNINKINPMEQDLGLNVSTKPPNSHHGNISCAKEKPPVLVKIDLNLLDRVLCVDRHSPFFLKPKEHLSGKHHKKLPSAKYSTSDIRSKKVHNDAVKDKVSKSTASKLSANSEPDIDLSDKKYVPEKERIPNVNLTSRKDISKSHVPSFESLPVREQIGSESLSDDDSDSDSDGSASEIDDSKQVESVHDSLSTSNHSSFSKSPLEKKKRKLNTTRDDDTKRRKTLSKSPANMPATELVKELQPVEISVPIKRERHGSASSQHSTLSNVSQRSSHSQKGSQGHRSQKRARTHDDVGSSHGGVRLSSGAINRSHDRSKSTAVVTPVVKYETLDTPSQNGFVVHNPPFYRSMMSDKEEEERLLPAEDYNRKAKKYKYQADDMDPGLTKFVLYLESVLCFIQYGYAQERDHKITEASNMYKETYRFVSHQFHQFRMYHDLETMEKTQKLTVLCLRIQSLVYLKLYMLRKNETVKLKRILEDHNNKSVKSSSQPKAPSAPSPHQPSWNRSTGTPSPMSPTPSPANSVCSVGSVGSDVTPSKISNGSSGQGQIAPPGSVIVPQRIHSITQKYFSNTCYLIQAHELWDQATSNITSDNREFFAQLDLDCGPLTLHSSLLHLVRYVKQAISQLNL